MTAPAFPDRVWELSTSTGTGNFSPAGAVTGYRTFSSSVGTNVPIDYTIEGVTIPGEWESGRGTWNGSALTRDTVTASSNGGAKVSFSAGTKNLYHSATQMMYDVLGNDVYVKAHFGAKGDNSTDDTTAIGNAIAAVASLRGQRLIFEPGVYVAPAGITESKRGLVAVGLGATAQGPGQQGLSIGAVIKATNTGAWVWRKQAYGDTNDYTGGRFENLTFMGDADTAGSLKIESSYCVVLNCESYGNLTGIGFLITTPTGGDSAQINKLIGCGSSDDLVGFQVDAGCNTILIGCYNLKYGVGGIGSTGTGCIIKDSASQVIGGKFEGNNVGISLQSTGTVMIGTQFEANNVSGGGFDVDYARPSGTSVTGNLVISASAQNVRFGANQYCDVFIGGGQNPSAVTDNGNYSMVLGKRILKIDYVGTTTPTGGLSGEIKSGHDSGTGKGALWLNDNGTWVKFISS